MRKLILILFVVLLFSCKNISDTKNLTNDSSLIGKYRTEYLIHYNSGYVKRYEIYSNKEIYTCSFQGTNFLLEKDNTEEILSTTAQIEIIKTEIVK